MTEQAKDAIPSGEQEVKGLATPELSGGSKEAGSQPTGLDVDALVEKVTAKLGPAIDNLIDARFKSGKDKRFNDLHKVAQYVKEAGGDEKLAVRNMTLDTIAEERGTLPVGDSPKSSDEEDRAYMQAKSTELLKAAGVSTDDPEYLELVRTWNGKIRSAERWNDVVATFADRRRGKTAKQETPVAQAAVAAPAKATPDEGDQIAELTKRLTYLQDHDPVKNRAERKEVAAKLAKLTGGR